MSKSHKVGLSFMTVISIVGVAVGVAALVIVLSVMGGFERDLREKMFRGLPHLELMHKNAIAGFSLKEYPLKKFNSVYPEAVAVEPFIQVDVVLKNRKHLQSVTVFGIEPDLGGKLWGFSSGMIQGDINSLKKKHSPAYDPENNGIKYPGIILDEEVAIQLSTDVGDKVTLISPMIGMQAATTDQKLSTVFVVAGIFRTDSTRQASRYVVTSLEDARKFMADYDVSLDEEEYVSGVAVNLENPDKVELFEERATQFKDLNTLSWKVVNKSLLFALKLEKFTMGAILFLIVLVAAFSISGTIMMTVFHKRGQVALLKSLGMSSKKIARLFLIHGASIGTIGIIAGLALGLSVCLFLDLTQAIDLPQGVYYQSKMPVKFLPVEYVVISVCAWLLSVTAAVYPAYVAAKQEPSIGLRYV